MSMTQNNLQAFPQSLLKWFSENRRDLPWRKTSNPYYIWISEVMLQQTQVETVIPYYERFITRFPTMYDLARADIDALLKEWEGLGYYSRARNLQSGVREVVEHYHAKVPSNKDDLLKVKGIGPYTAGAILSIAYQKREPAVDGNVMRVATRVFDIHEDITKARTRKLIEATIRDYIPEDAASEFNQALMELGALICKPKAPKCRECPLAPYCIAYKKGIQESLPVKKKKIKQKKLYYGVLVLQNEKNEFYIQRRPESGLLAGLWEFPMVSIEEKEDTLIKGREYIEQLGVKAELLKTDIKLSHVFSHLKWELNVVFGTCHEIKSLSQSGQWVSRKRLEDFPLPVPHQKIKNSLGCVVSQP